MDITDRNDITNLIFRAVVPLVGCVAAAMATVYMMQEINPLAAFCACTSLVFFVLTVVSPRAGLVVLLIACAYSDLLKRMLVFWGELSFQQVSYVLAMAPLVVAGLIIAVITRWAFHRVEIGLGDFLLVMGICAAIGVNLLLAKRAGAGLLEAMKDAANTGLYLTLLPVGLKILERPEQIDRFIRHARLIFIPVAVYGIYQAIFGLADFEIEYLRSGLTIMIKELTDLRPRPFSTLNSAGTLGAIMAMLTLLSLHPLLASHGRPSSVGERIKSFSLSLLYVTASFCSLARSSILVWTVAFFAFWCFKSRRRTQIFYATAGAAFVLLLIFSPYILEHIAEWDPTTTTQSEFVGQAFRIQTYAERLKGFVNLTHSTDMYSWLGLPEDQKMGETTYHHDPLSAILIDTGVVGLGVALGTLIFGLAWIHRRLLRLPIGHIRTTAVLLTAVNTGVLVSHLLFHGVLTSFPVNTLFWLFTGMTGFLVLWQPDPALEESVPATGSGDAVPRWARAPEPQRALRAR